MFFERPRDAFRQCLASDVVVVVAADWCLVLLFGVLLLLDLLALTPSHPPMTDHIIITTFLYPPHTPVLSFTAAHHLRTR